MSRDKDFERTRETPLDFARLRALMLARQLGVSAGEVNEAFGILANALGIAWLNEAAEDVPNGRALPFRRHPIGDLVSTAGALQLSELIELAFYLRTTALIPGAAQVVANLKTAAYRQTFFQLAFADMIAKAGARLLRFEPPSDDGRFADIEALVAKEQLHVECFRPTYRVVDPNERVLLAQNILEVCRDAPIFLSVAIQLNCELTPSVRRDTVAVVKDLATDVVTRSAATRDMPTAMTETPSAVISVCRGLAVKAGSERRFLAAPGFPKANETPELFMRAASSAPSEVTGLYANFDKGIGGSHIAIWFHQDDPEEAKASPEEKLLKLSRKLERKLSQARAGNASARLLAVDTAIVRDIKEIGGAAFARLRGKLLGSHRAVRALFLMKRDPLPNADRHRYMLRVLLPSEPPELDDAFVRCLSQLPNVELV